jgi:murein L,D-transpeptidase YcbB/YkuD
MAAVVISCRREDNAGSTKLPEKSTEPEETAVWVRKSGLTARGEQAVIALRSASTRGLRPADYSAGLDAPTDAAISTNLARYVADIRNGRFNTGVYKSPEYKAGEVTPPAGTLVQAVADDPEGLEAGLRKLDPPFDGYRRLVVALDRARQDGAPQEQIAQMELTLERWRWLPRTYERGPILVNLPEFRLRVLNDDLQVALEMKAVVGQLGHPTPQFMGQMKYLMFAPYWNVPKSILKRELVPDIEKERGYLAAHSYEVLSLDGEVIAPEEKVSDETLEALKAGTLKVRQKPGAGNALGRVKFMFPNQDAIYLHDTNAPKLFAKDERAFSHGCVRVEQPQALAEWVLQEEVGWTPERVAAALKSKTQLQANLKRPVPVLMLYHTVTVDADGSVHFHKDLYGQDAALLAQMMAKMAAK